MSCFSRNEFINDQAPQNVLILEPNDSTSKIPLKEIIKTMTRFVSNRVVCKSMSYL